MVNIYFMTLTTLFISLIGDIICMPKYSLFVNTKT